ncbi:dTDP-4-dehydrorhamnose reductase [Evansella tamaricis]|uniref:dTDP-4-dehydrorhamnose reductase n=1 Tax=Evansella tamaricis TaxID=2069301 RepID=A0ABS6JI38_9BACI|nr:dTDP-4-dehydrorhamnose reductase [Evansella tamaricis]MBU9713293.1 dTDP-4-dehydrorhamnose reductase [Evansella tamaricis]
MINNVLITGKRGQLSRALQNVLEERQVVFLPLGREEMDIKNFDSVCKYIMEWKPSIILHTGAWTEVDGAEEHFYHATQVNVQGTKNILKAAEKVRASVLYMSSDYVFDGESSMAYMEADKPKPVNHYGFTKWLGEEYVQNYRYDWWIVRTSWIFGGDVDNFVRKIVVKAQKRERINVVNDQSGSPTYVKDLARIVINLLEKKTGIYHVCNQGKCSRHELAEYIYSKITGQKDLVYKTTTQQFGNKAVRPKNSVLNMNMLKINSIPLPRSWEKAVDEYLKHI